MPRRVHGNIVYRPDPVGRERGPDLLSPQTWFHQRRRLSYQREADLHRTPNWGHHLGGVHWIGNGWRMAVSPPELRRRRSPARRDGLLGVGQI
jgi:hypothetical protein